MPKMSAEEMMKRARRAQRDRNRRFAQLPPNKQRVQIAKDVLEYLKLGKIKAKEGIYMSLDKYVEKVVDFMEGFDPTEDIRDMDPVERKKYLADLARYSEFLDKDLAQLMEQSTSCNVCGIGAVFTAACRRADKLKVNDFMKSGGGGKWSDQAMREYLDQWFDQDQRALIEQAFEEGTAMNERYHNVPYNTMKDAEEFGKKFKAADDRLAAIMKNIVENDGEFVPPSAAED